MARKPKTGVPRIPSKRQNPLVVSDSVAMRARGRKVGPNPFKLPQHPPGVVPADKSLQMAMDNWGANEWGQQWAGDANAWFIGGIFEEGLVFPGYANLAGQAQRPEYRKFAEIIATEMTRKWIRITSTDEEDSEGVEEKIKEIEGELERLRARDVLRKCVELDELFGRSHLYIDTGDTENRDELKTSIGNGRDEVSRAKIGKGGLKALRAIEPVWVYPIDYTAIDPLRDDWYEPQTWFVLGKQVHRTRLLKFVGREVPDLLKPAYSFGGLSMTQMARPYVDNWLRTRQSVSDLIHAFSVFVLKTNLATSTADSGDQLFKRVDLFNNMRDNRGTMVVDKETEDFANVSANIGGLHELQSQSQEQLCSVSSIPTVKFLGIQPTGLNNSDEGGIRMFYDWIAAQQEKRVRSQLTSVIDFVQLSLYGEIDPHIVWHFEPLREMDEQQEAELRQKEAQTDIGYIDSGVLSQYEVRKKVASDPDSPYASIDVDDVPELKQEEEEGLDPRAGGAMGKGGKLPHPALQPAGEEGEEEDEFPDEDIRDDEIDEDNVVELPDRRRASVRRYATSHGSPISEAPFEARAKARTGRHETLGSPAFEKAGAERQAAWKRGEGPFHERAKQRTEASKDYLKHKLVARKSGLLAAAGLDKAPDYAFDAIEWEESKHPRGQPGNAGQFGPGGAGGASTESSSKSSKSSSKVREIDEQDKDAMGDYSFRGDTYANAILRGNGDELQDWQRTKGQSVIKGMDRAFESAEPLHEDTTFYRGFRSTEGMDRANLEDYVGKSFVDKGFTSTSTERAVANAFSSNKAGEYLRPGETPDYSNGIVMSITVPKGTRMVDLSHGSNYSGDEGEMVLPRGGRFTVTKVERPSKTGLLFKKEQNAPAVLHVTYTPPDTPYAHDSELDFDGEEWVEWNPEDEEVAEDDAQFESKHPRGPDGKFASYNAGPNLKKALAEHGFGKAFKSKMGKLLFTDANGNKIVVEPPTGGAKQSSKWTLHTKDGKKIEGETGKTLTGQMQKLGSQPAAVKEAVKSILENAPGGTAPATKAKPEKQKKLTKTEQKEADKKAVLEGNPDFAAKFKLVDAAYYYSKPTLKKAKDKIKAAVDFGVSKEDLDKVLTTAEKNAISKNWGTGGSVDALYNTHKENAEKTKKAQEEAKAKLDAALKQAGVKNLSELSKADVEKLYKKSAISYSDYNTALEEIAEAGGQKLLQEVQDKYSGDLTKLSMTDATTLYQQGKLDYSTLQKIQEAHEAHQAAQSQENLKDPATTLYQKWKAGEVTHHDLDKHCLKILKRMQDKQPPMTAAQKSAIASYSGSAYTHYNAHMRNSSKSIEECLESNPQCKQIQSYLKTSKIDQDQIVWRKVDSSFADHVRSTCGFKGATFQDRSFGSTSVGPHKWSGSLTMEIALKKGQSGAAISHVSYHSNEMELMLPAGTIYRVTEYDRKSQYMKVEVVEDTAELATGSTPPASSTPPAGSGGSFDPNNIPDMPDPSKAPTAPENKSWFEKAKGALGLGGGSAPAAPAPVPAKTEQDLINELTAGNISPHDFEQQYKALSDKFDKQVPTSTSTPTHHSGKTPLNMSDLVKVGPQLGSNEGGKYKDIQGNEYYVKKGKSIEHINNELLAGDLFKAAGAGVLDYHPVEGGDYIATKWEKMDKTNVSEFTEAERKQAQENFAVHAWLANWDAAGTGGDNQSVKGDKVISNDLGGALLYRAKGAPKGDAFGNMVGEWSSMRDPAINPDNAKLFGGMTQAELKESAKKVTSIPNETIRQAVKNNGFGIDLADKLIARKYDLADKAGITLTGSPYK